MKYCFSQEDLAQIQAKGMTAETVEEQLECFKKGFPYLKLENSASLGNGIMQLSDSAESYAEKWDKLIEEGVKSVKFVPASGAASRMFKDLFGFLDAEYDAPENALSFDGLSVLVKAAEGHTCDRCWLVVPSANEEGICPRCAEVIEA